MLMETDLPDVAGDGAGSLIIVSGCELRDSTSASRLTLACEMQCPAAPAPPLTFANSFVVAVPATGRLTSDLADASKPVLQDPDSCPALPMQQAFRPELSAEAAPNGRKADSNDTSATDATTERPVHIAHD